jgi:hypothetical protein
MAHLSGIHIAKQARALAAALVLGTAVLGLSAGSATAAPNQRDDIMCTTEYYNDEGQWQIDFYLPGERVRGLDRYAQCYKDNGWGEAGWDDAGPVEP